MKLKLNLLMQIHEIDAILAAESLFPWVGEYVQAVGEGLQTVAVENNENRREIYQPEGVGPCIWAITHDSKTLVYADANQAIPPPLAALLAAMGLRPENRGTTEVSLGSIDGEELQNRVQELDCAWVLLRRLKQFEPDPSKVLQSAHTLIQFALNWNRYMTDYVNDAETKSTVRRGEVLEAQARKFSEWGVAGLERLELHCDPRGSAMTLQFTGYHDMALCGLTLDWAVGRTFTLTLPSEPVERGRYDVVPTKVSQAVLGVLSGLAFDGNQVRITKQLSTKLYNQVNEVLLAMGGKWITGAKAHLFDEDPVPLLDRVLESGSIYTERDFEFFETQAAEVAMVIKQSGIQPGMSVMEPNGGAGALAMAAAEIVGKSQVTCYELMPANVKRLNALGFNVEKPTDFLSVTPEPRFDAVVMNPPFSGGRDVAHIRHAMGFLKAGGTLTAIASTQWQTHNTMPAKEFQSYLAKLGARVTAIPAGAFHASGTDVQTTLLHIRKPLDELPQQGVLTKTQLQETEVLQASLF
jgi:predicted RNA methylase